jgi:UV DNA damage endonuclease
MKLGLCCISLNLKEEGYSFKKITYKKFSSLPREKALILLGEKILNNLLVTNKTIRYCYENNLCYRMSSELFPLITYDKADVNLIDLPNYQDISNMFEVIKETIKETNVRISSHPSEYNVLASKNELAVDKTIKELNFYSWFMDQIGCPANYDSPMNLHIHNNDGDSQEIIDRLLKNCEKLDRNCWNRLVFENDDKINCWSVNKLIKYYYSMVKKPITFDYLHHKCHPDSMNEEDAILACYETWGRHKPLFHYSESREGKNPRAHCDIPSKSFCTYGLDFDLDFEVKQKDVGIKYYQNLSL